MGFKVIYQHDAKDCGCACLAMICRHYGLNVSVACIRSAVKIQSYGTTVLDIVKGSEKLGLCAEAYFVDASEFYICCGKKLPLPFIAHIVNENGMGHFVVIYKLSSQKVYIADPGKGKCVLKLGDFLKIWTNNIISLKPSDCFKSNNSNLGSMKKYYSLIFSNKRLFVVSVFMSAIISVIGVCGTFVLKELVEKIQHSTPNVVWEFGIMCVFISLLYVLQAVINYLRGFTVANISKRIESELTASCFSHLLKLPSNFFDSRNTGELLSRFSDIVHIRDTVSATGLTVFLDFTMIIFSGVVLFIINNKLFYITVATSLIYSVLTLVFINPLSEKYREMMEYSADFTSHIKESVSGIETIKCFGAESRIFKIVQSKNEKMLEAGKKAMLTSSLLESFEIVITSLGTIAVLWFGLRLVSEGTVSLGMLLVYYSLMNCFSEPMKDIVSIQPQLHTAFISMCRLNDIFDTAPEAGLTTSKGFDKNGDIIFQNVTFGYSYNNSVLNNVNLHIKKGEKVALVGESGCGKTTVSKLLLAFYKPDSGNIYIGNTDISEISISEIRRNVVYISQDIELFSDTLKNNLTMYKELYTYEEIKRACVMSGIWEFIESLPEGLDTVIGENGNCLSVGQKQRLAIARAFLKNPKILIMDEATSNLDTITEQTIKNAVNSLENTTCIIIAHRLSTIKNCDKIFVMERGTIVQEGAHEQLLKQNGLYKDFCDKI